MTRPLTIPPARSSHPLSLPSEVLTHKTHKNLTMKTFSLPVAFKRSDIYTRKRARSWRNSGPTYSRPVLSSCKFTTSSSNLLPYFDSHQFVTRLENEGLNREQSEGLMLAIEQVIDESMKNLITGLVTRIDFAKLKSEIQLVEKQDFALLKSENERLISELEKLKQRLREEITRTQASVRLDLNLEKGRIRDELGVRELKIREVDTRIEGEIGNLRTTMESVKFNILQYVVGTVASGGALLLAYIRMFR
ncbi:hypothetical protein PSTG_08384 [Puccinia striiformis f. sp. tritici PST-78]|uniref:DUF1640 domain-containing protein n=1 Tax=Puccinia striiformis f. sp. tritici PST-78 TaxID=1165861 RepID=A0A0L0VH19_9BASI|nr:hypothetical protein PSTG_08384 [Puccinia striiformis f. sp. tritici PST-78]